MKISVTICLVKQRSILIYKVSFLSGKCVGEKLHVHKSSRWRTWKHCSTANTLISLCTSASIFFFFFYIVFVRLPLSGKKHWYEWLSSFNCEEQICELVWTPCPWGSKAGRCFHVESYLTSWTQSARFWNTSML